MTEPNTYFAALLIQYTQAANSATQDLKKNWPILIGSIGAYVALKLLYLLVGGLGILGGFIIGVGQIALLTLYYGWIRSTLNRERLKINDLLNFDTGLFFAIISVGFLIWIIEYLIQPFWTSEDTIWFAASVTISIYILCNAVPEIIMLTKSESFQALKEGFNFIMRYWIEWFVPLVVVLTPLLAASPYLVLGILSGVSGITSAADPLVPIMTMTVVFNGALSQLIPSGGFLTTLIALVAANWFVLFRGHLFKKLWRV